MDRITLRIESVGENEHVSLDDFVAQLVAIRAALERTDAAMNAGQQTLIWEVVGLSHSSPATIELEPRTRRRANAAIAAPSEVIRTFTSSLQALALDKAPPRELDNAAIAAFRALAAPVAANRVQSAIHTPNETIPIVKTIETAAARVIEEDLQSTGTFKGLLEFLNIHGRKSEFRIYPIAGPNFITCEFTSDKLNEAREAVGRSVVVHGRLTYKARAPFPYRIAVEEIEVLPLDDDLPRFRDLIGAAPGATGEATSEEFVRRLRDAS